MRKISLGAGWTGVQRIADIAVAGICACLLGCVHPAPEPAGKQGNYPEAIGKIIGEKCATSGCHNDRSYINAAGLNLSTWNSLFRGSGTGSVVVPYRPDYSSLCYFTNTDSSLGISLVPTMPLNLPPLSREEYQLIVDWISIGAPDASGTVCFSGDPDRSKLYVTNRMCDVVTVVDAGSLLQMRYLDVGTETAADFPLIVRTAPDKKHWYVSFFAPRNHVQQFDASTDAYLEDITLGEGSWHSFLLAPDGATGYFADHSASGKIVAAGLKQHQEPATYSLPSGLWYPKGMALHPGLGKLFVGSSQGNFIYTINLRDSSKQAIGIVPIDGTQTPQYHASGNATDLLADTVSGLLYLACEGSGDLRILDMKTEKLLSVVPLGSPPAFMELVQASGLLFISCPDDTYTFPGNRGSVKVLDLQTQRVIKTINTGYQPYGLAYHPERKLVAVVNANISSEGPGSHHSSKCGVKNGNLSFIDPNSLELLPGSKLELAVFPYGVAAR